MILLAIGIPVVALLLMFFQRDSITNPLGEFVVNCLKLIAILLVGGFMFVALAMAVIGSLGT